MKKILLLAVMALSTVCLYAQDISGRVTDSAGTPLVGVLVTKKSTPNVGATFTDQSGQYIMEKVPASETLVFDYMGYEIQEIVAGTQSVLNVQLVESALQLDEVVVVGYGTMRKSDLSAAITSVSEDDLKEKPITQVTDALVGKVPGVYIQGQSGSPGSTPVIRIRGANSISTSNAPLIVVDGSMIGGDLSSVNPSDIASMEILKDASATAIYGSQGANGVILVTTKSGLKGKTVVSLNSFFGVQQITKQIDVMDAYEYATNVNLRRSVGKNNSDPDNINGEKSYITSDPDYNYYSQDYLDKFAAGELNVNWQDEIYNSAFMQNHQLSLRSGTDKTQIMASINYLNQDGVMMNTSYEKLAGRMKIDTKISDKFKWGGNVFVSRSTNHPESTAAEDALYALPTGTVYKEDGSYFNNRESMSWGNSSPNTASSLWNPVAQAVESVRDVYITTVNATSYIDYYIIDGLTFKINASTELYDYNENNFYNEYTKYGWGTDGGQAEIYDSRSTKWQNSNILSYNKVINDHSFNATALFEQSFSQWEGNSIVGQGFIDPSKLYHDMSAASIITSKDSNKGESALLSYMARLNYSYKNKYIFTGALRADGSSKFGANNKWAYFPSASVAWRVTGEDFMKSLPNVSDFKIRASWGVTGNQGIESYETMSGLYMGGSYSYPIDGSSLSVGSGYASTLTNQDLKWEKTAQTDLGFDLSIFQNKLRFTLDLYYKRTNDLLLDMEVPQYTGYSSVRANVGSVENKGIEFMVESNRTWGDFSWSSAFNIATNKNKVLSLSTDYEEMMATSCEVSYVMVGQPLGVFYGYEYQGVFLPGEEAEAASYGQQIGTPKITDVNGDGVYDENDKTVIGDPTPDFTFGFNNKFTYKNFSLNIFLQGSVGNDIYNYSARNRFDYEDVGGNYYQGLQRWHPTVAPDGYYTRYEYDNVLNLAFDRKEAYNSTMFIEDGSYLRVKNITFSYNLPKKVLGNWGLSNVRLYASVDNLWTITGYTGYDPEAGASSTDSINGVDYTTYPTIKTFMFGFDITF